MTEPQVVEEPSLLLTLVQHLMEEAMLQTQEQVLLIEPLPETQVLQEVHLAEEVPPADLQVYRIRVQVAGVVVTADQAALLQGVAVAIQALVEVQVAVAIQEEVVEVQAPEVVVEALQVQEDQDN